MSDIDLAARFVEVLRKSQYANIATSRNDVPWNTPATALPDADLTFYWSSWTKAEHSQNVSANGGAFLTFYDSTRVRGTNNLRGLYLQCRASEVVDVKEAEKAFGILYPDETVDLSNFLGEGVKRFYRAVPQKAWLNSLSEKELEPTTLKMRTEVAIADIKKAYR